MSEQDHPLEPFKRATTATIRAIAGNDELEVSFGQGPASVRGNRIRVPLPSIGASLSATIHVRMLWQKVKVFIRLIALQKD